MSGQITESCSCGAQITASSRAGLSIATAPVETFRQAHAVCRQPTIGRCGIAAPALSTETTAQYCALPHGHKGWHSTDGGLEWIEGKAS